MDKLYLGDGVYIDTGEGYLILTTSNGISNTNTIYLEPQVAAELLEYIKEWMKE